MSGTWQSISRERGTPLNDQYFMVYCETKEKMYDFRERMKENYGFEFIPAYSGGLLTGPWMYFNLNTRFMFYGNIGVNVLSGPVIGEHALTMDEFVQIADIYKKYEGKSLLAFTEEGQRHYEERNNREYKEYVSPYNVEEMTFEEYKIAVMECLKRAMDGYCQEAIENSYKEYREELPEFYRKKFSPEAAATAILYDF